MKSQSYWNIARYWKAYGVLVAALAIFAGKLQIDLWATTQRATDADHLATMAVANAGIASKMATGSIGNMKIRAPEIALKAIAELLNFTAHKQQSRVSDGRPRQRRHQNPDHEGGSASSLGEVPEIREI